MDNISVDNKLVEKVALFKYLKSCYEENKDLKEKSTYQKYLCLCEYFKAYHDAGLENIEFAVFETKPIHFRFGRDNFKMWSNSNTDIVVFEYEPISEDDFKSRPLKVAKTEAILKDWLTFKASFEKDLNKVLDDKIKQYR